jgi:hypothetical protein
VRTRLPDLFAAGSDPGACGSVTVGPRAARSCAARDLFLGETNVRGVLRRCAVLAAVAGLAACSSSTGAAPESSVATRTVVRTRTPDPVRTAQTSTGPTRAAAAARCPLLPKQAAADTVGMRLARITVLRSGGAVVGCRFYALQNSPLAQSEHLPGPHQPAIEIETTRYPTAVAAHNAFVRVARRGTNPQQASIGLDNPGVCFQTAFFPPDHGRDWACAFSVVRTEVVVRTVVVSPALNVILLSRQVARRL